MNKLTVITARLKGFQYGNTLRPARDWMALLLGTLLLLAASIIWNLWTFSEVTKGDAVGSEGAPENTDTSAIESALKIFEERQVEEQKYRSEYRFVDPS